jgi:hypothetical protein
MAAKGGGIVLDLLRGSLIVLRRRCGKPNCHCATGDPHETPALSWSEGGKTQILTLRPEEVRQVAAAVGRYKKARAELDRKAAAGLRALRRMQAARGR